MDFEALYFCLFGFICGVLGVFAVRHLFNWISRYGRSNIKCPYCDAEKCSNKIGYQCPVDVDSDTSTKILQSKTSLELGTFSGHRCYGYMCKECLEKLQSSPHYKDKVVYVITGYTLFVNKLQNGYYTLP